MLSLLWLLLPVAAASGWYAAKRTQAQQNPPKHSLSPQYFQGLNYLIDEKPDKAIKVFCQLVETNDPEALELHLALGNLFRRRGEGPSGIPEADCKPGRHGPGLQDHQSHGRSVHPRGLPALQGNAGRAADSR